MAPRVARSLIFILLLISAVEGRILGLTSSDDRLISDGIDGAELSLTASCRHEYGFLPCAENAAGYIFMIVVYQVLLIVANEMIVIGSQVLRDITGADYGGILLRILRALPSMMLMILSGIFSNQADAQSQVSVVVGVYAGITVFDLTVQWFMCMVSESKYLEDSDHHKGSLLSNCFPPKKEMLRNLIDYGVKVDDDTCKTARIMLLSLIPYIVLQLVYVFPTSSGKRVMTLIALIFSSLSLIVYFVYLRRSLDYSKFDIVQRKFVKMVERLGKLVKKDGTLDVGVLKRFFDHADKDGDKCLTYGELECIVSHMFKAKKTDNDQNEAMNNVMSKFDNNEDKRITEEEFIEGFEKWIQDATKYSASRSPKEMFHNAREILREKNKYNFQEIDRIMSKILKQADGQLLKSESLITHDGEPNIDRIQRLFRDYDSNNDGSLTSTELKKLIGKVKFGAYQMKDDDVAHVVKALFTEFDKDHNEVIDEDEFIKGVKGYLEKAMEYVEKTEITRAVEEFDKIVWKEVKYGWRAFFKSILQVLLGLATMTVLAKPLMSSILQLSNAMNFPSSIVSFVVVPLAMNSRAAIAAILRDKDISSKTFSEISGGVIMNNIAGLTTLLAIVYAKELTWDFSAEVLTILVVCGIIGLQALLSTTYHLWTCIPAFLLYPISLGLLYFVQEFLNWN